MLEEALYHKPETEYCYPKSESAVALRLRTAKSDFPVVNVIYGGKYDFAEKHCRAAMRLAYKDGLYHYYTAEIELKDVRLVYVFELKEGNKTFYFSEDGLSEQYDFTLNYFNAFQLAYINAADVHRSVPWMRSARFYQIFIDRFYRGNFEKEDGYINLDWGEIPNPKSFAGGDLLGIAEKLDYLTELGINALYLTPVFKSVSNHKYDIEDYYAIDEMFGNENDFGLLIERAHSKGMRVVLDAVFNHASARCKEFRDVLKHGKNSPYFHWFIVRGDRVDTEEVNYECFASCGYMPKWNTSNAEVRDFLIGIGLYWIKKYDIDGWRLDVSDEVSHVFWREFRTAVKRLKPDCVIIGENWHDANAYLHGDQYDSVMNYAFTKACIDFFVREQTNARGFSEKLNGLLMRNTDTVNFMMLNLLDSHDTHRFITQAQGDIGKLESALAVLYMFAGAPCIYYGTEIAAEGGYDPDCRRTMDWEKAERGGKIREIIRSLARLRETSGAFYSQDIRIYSEGERFVLERGEGKGALRLSVNGGEKALPLCTSVCTNAAGALKKFEFMIEIL